MAGVTRGGFGLADLIQMTGLRGSAMAFNAEDVGIVRNRAGVHFPRARVEQMVGVPEFIDVLEQREFRLMSQMADRAIVTAGVQILSRRSVAARILAMAGEADGVAGLNLLLRFLPCRGSDGRMAIGALRLRGRARCFAARCGSRVLMRNVGKKIAEIAALV